MRSLSSLSVRWTNPSKNPKVFSFFRIRSICRYCKDSENGLKFVAKSTGDRLYPVFIVFFGRHKTIISRSVELKIDFGRTFSGINLKTEDNRSQANLTTNSNCFSKRLLNQKKKKNTKKKCPN